MSEIWRNGPADPMQRLVLLAIADHADDQGRAYPSMVGIASKCAMSERGVRGIIRKLEAGGWLNTRVGGGRGGKSHYTVNPEPQTRNDKPGMTNPEYERPKTRNDTTLNPEPRSAEPSRTIIKPSKGARDVLAEVIGEETADAFIEMRKAIKKPLTLHAANLLCKRVKGHADPKSVFERSIENSWAGVFPENTGHKQRTDPTKHRTVPRPGGPMERPFKIVK